MASARTLSAAELGAARYERARRDGRWAVQVRVGRAARDDCATAYAVEVDGGARHRMALCAAGDWRVTFGAPPALLSYRVLRDGRLVATGGLQVRPPDPPLLLPFTLRCAVPPPATVLPPPPPAADGAAARQDGAAPRARVLFVFEQHSWLASSARVRGTSFDVRMKRVRTRFEALVALPPGRHAFCFVLQAREALPPHALPFSALGWDLSAAESAAELVTWPQPLLVPPPPRAPRAARFARVWRTLARVAYGVAAVSLGFFLVRVGARLQRAPRAPRVGAADADDAADAHAHTDGEAEADANADADADAPATSAAALERTAALQHALTQPA